MTSPCAGAWAGYHDLPVDVASLHSPEEWRRWLALASEILFAATGRRWRGGGRTAEAVLRAAPPQPGQVDAWAYDRSWGNCCWTGTLASGLPVWGARHAHLELPRVRLPHPDVTAVTSVLLDGDPFTWWRLDGAWLTRTDGKGWPLCSERAVVAYEWGKAPPDGGRLAAAELAAEYGKAAVNDSSCRLPERVRSVSRQGISFEVIDPMEHLEKGLTGISTIDAWILATNPYQRKQPGRVWSPELARARRTP